MKDNWAFTSLIFGIIAGILFYFFVPVFKIALGVSVLVTVILLFLNPKRWFRRIFVLLFTTWCFQLDKTIEILSDIFNIKFQITGNRLAERESLFLLALCGLILIIESNKKIRGTLFKITKKNAKKFSGNDYSVNINGNNNTVSSTVNVLKFNEHDLKPFTELIDSEIESLQKRIENKSKIADLDQEVFRMSEKLYELQNQRTILENQVKDLLEKTESESSENMPELFNKAYDLFKKGKIEESLKLLDEERLMQEQIKYIGSNKILSDIRLLKARILNVINDFDTAIKNYEKANVLNPSWIISLELAGIYSSLNDDDNSIRNFENSLNYSKIEGQKGISHYNYGIYYSEKNNYDNAKYHLNQALKLSQDITVDSFKGFKLDKCKVLNALGTLYNKISINNPKAEDVYNEAISIYKKRLDLKMIEYEPDYANVLYNYSFFLMQKGNYNDSLKYIQESIDIRERLYKKLPKEFSRQLVDSYNRLANLLINENKLIEAKVLFEKAIFLNRTLAEIDPESLLSLEMSLANFGNVMAMLNQPEEAEELYLEALGIIRKLVKVNRKKYIPKQSDILLSLGAFYFQSKKDKDKSIKYLAELIMYLYPVRKVSTNVDYYIDTAFTILNNWGIDRTSFLKENGLE